MARLRVNLLKIFILPYIVLLVHLIYNYQEIKLDGLDAEVWCFYTEEDTKYSNKFSHKKFSTITFGMTNKEVCDLLGEPLRHFYVTETPIGNKGNFTVLCFSIPVDGKSYRKRFVYVENDKVIETLAAMYYD